MKRYYRNFSFAVLLGLLLPGLGHVYWREFLFGLFVMLVMIIASVLVFFSFLAPLPLLLKLILFGLPGLFYIFSFVDLRRSILRKQAKVAQTGAAAIVLVVLAVSANLLLPLSPVNFLIRNHPELGRAAADAPEPFLRAGDFYVIDRAAYRVNLFFLDQSYVRATPDRFDVVALENDDAQEKIAWVLGFGGEEVAFHDGALTISGIEVERDPGAPTLTGEIPLTRVETGSILVASLDESGQVGTTLISDRNIVGKVHRLF